MQDVSAIYTHIHRLFVNASFTKFLLLNYVLTGGEFDYATGVAVAEIITSVK